MEICTIFGGQVRMRERQREKKREIKVKAIINAHALYIRYIMHACLLSHFEKNVFYLYLQLILLLQKISVLLHSLKTNIAQAFFIHLSMLFSQIGFLFQVFELSFFSFLYFFLPYLFFLLSVCIFQIVCPIVRYCNPSFGKLHKQSVFN